jgi:diaminopimelate decarboxylase
MLLGTQSINGDGILEIGGCDTVSLAREFGTPLYVLDEQSLRGNCKRYRAAFESRYPDTLISFAAKALMNMAVCRIADQEGLGLDVVSAGELYTALQAGFPADRVFMHGSDKSLQEMEMALTHRVGRIVLDNLDEIAALQQLADSRDAVVDVIIRVTPGVRADTHTHIQTGKVDTKFGLAIVGGAAREGASRAAAAPNLRLRGIHCHIGSQILDLEPFRQTAELMTSFAAEAHKDLGCPIEELNLGGGLGVRYLPTDQPASVEDYAETVSARSISSLCRN